MNQDVFLLAAGLGTRLRPLTEKLPKPLIEVNGKPLIVYHLERLAKEGLKRVMINLHYLPDQIRNYIGSGDKWGLEVSYSFEPALLDTGGGVKNVEKWINSKSLLIINSDSLFDPTFCLNGIVSNHLSHEPALTMLVGPADNRLTPLYVNDQEELVGFGKAFLPTSSSSPVSYLGVMMLNCRLLTTAPPLGVPFSLTSGIIPNLLSSGDKIRTVRFNKFWSDVGTPEGLEQASKYFEKI